jgi:hypothetical protein
MDRSLAGVVSILAGILGSIPLFIDYFFEKFAWLQKWGTISDINLPQNAYFEQWHYILPFTLGIVVLLGGLFIGTILIVEDY